MTLLCRDERNTPIQVAEPENSQSISVTATSASITRSNKPGVVRLLATVDCYIKFGKGITTATTSDMYLAAFIPEYFRLGSDTSNIDSDTIAAIRVSEDGALNITEMR